ncbi:hypothetical protein PLICRDRAFT_47550 [Plicaturopsis crispa FD-325 SS-3]|nr:hypothetical protein PLICRDRAFT_47550 [Plicaturopsis crispa FD-325 SS-3]
MDRPCSRAPTQDGITAPRPLPCTPSALVPSSPLPASQSTPVSTSLSPSPSPSSPLHFCPKLSRKERARASSTLTTFATHLRLSELPLETHQYRPRSMYFPTFLLNRVLDNLLDIMCVEDLGKMCGTREWAFKERWESELWVVVRGVQEDVRKSRADGERDGEARVDLPAPTMIDDAEARVLPGPSTKHTLSQAPNQERVIARPPLPCENSALVRVPAPPPTQPAPRSPSSPTTTPPKLTRKERARASKTLTTFATHLRLSKLPLKMHQYRPRCMYFPTFLLNRILDNLLSIACVEDLGKMCGTREWAFKDKWEGELWEVVRGVREEVWTRREAKRVKRRGRDQGTHQPLMSPFSVASDVPAPTDSQPST